MRPLLSLPALPLILWKTPPGLELILAQEGVPTVVVKDSHPHAFAAGRFVIADRRKVADSGLEAQLTPEHVVIDLADLSAGLPGRPWSELVDLEGGPASWSVAGRSLVERVGRFSKASIRSHIIGRLRDRVLKSEGYWVRIAPYPAPYRSAFNLRVDLDEPVPEDYFRFAEARRPIDDCTTHFVSTRAYGDDRAVLEDLTGLDVQSHGHHHVIYREVAANARNLSRADLILREAGFDLEGFAAPHGRWNPGLDATIEGLGYRYSSDFQLGYDDLPFFPWVGGRWSDILQIPIHPVCEGLFLDAGIDSGRTISDYYAGVVGSKIEAEEPAFVYGHPERRLSRYPEIIAGIAREVDRASLVWRTTLTEFARWWRWRDERRWTLLDRGDGAFEIQFDEWDTRYPMAVEISRKGLVAHMPIGASRSAFRLDDFAYQKRPKTPAVSPPTPARLRRDWKSRVRDAIGWDAVTPIDEMPVGTIMGRVRRELRKHSDRHGRVA